MSHDAPSNEANKGVPVTNSFASILPGLVIWGGGSACIFLSANPNVPDFASVAAGLLLVSFFVALPIFCLTVAIFHRVGDGVLHSLGVELCSPSGGNRKGYRFLSVLAGGVSL